METILIEIEDDEMLIRITECPDYDEDTTEVFLMSYAILKMIKVFMLEYPECQKDLKFIIDNLDYVTSNTKN